MNDRLKELAEQAGYVPLDPPAFADDLQEIFLEKFAELIIAESIEVMKKNDYHAEWLGEKIKEYFGVNE